MIDYKITYLGHAGFSFETKKELFLIDPWFNPKGAFLNSWHQFPCNHFLINDILKKASDKITNIYITHEHEDHFCSFTLKQLDRLVENIFIPNYKIPTFKNLFSKYGIQEPKTLLRKNGSKYII